ncbi:MAG: MlaD family protein [Verrucomicrobiota bacterium]|jgi:phospholipid/cholesterol/gamma-HCH transport system substrate-binding protein|nr:MlaD family protein [Verrucomicrobiota bacterium]MDP6754255.1 MlaD family protein [Verrucomicrobiota bacterium]
MKAKKEWKVGLFLAIALVLAAGLVINFSKGTNPFTETTLLHLKTKNVDGLKRNSVVLMAGVPVGSISAIRLNTDTGIVTLDAKIKAEYKIRRDAKFFIETAGFLGDKYIGVIPGDIIPGDNKLPALKNGDVVICQESFDLVRTARSATDLMDELKTVASQITNIVERIDSKLLDEQTLTNLAAGLSNLREISAKATDTITSVDRLITTNTPPIRDAVNNVVAFSEQLKSAGGNMQQLVATNRVVIDESLDNIRQTTESLRNLVAAAERGEGLAGKLFSDQELSQNLSVLSSNLVEVSTKLNQGGLWGILWKDKKKDPDDGEPKKLRPAGGRNRR